MDAARVRRPPAGLTARLDTRDVDDAREHIGRSYCPHALTPQGPGFHARHLEGGGADLGVYLLSYGAAPVQVEPAAFQDFVLLSRPVAGSLAVRTGRRRTVVGTGDVVALDAQEEHELTFGPGARLLTVKVPTVHLLRAAEVDGGPTTVRTGLLADRGAWDAVSRFLLRDALPGGLLAGPLARSVVHLVAAAVLGAAGTAPTPDHGRNAAAVVQRARDFARANAQSSIGLLDMAAAAGVSPRTLQQHFRDQLATTPGAYLRGLRLAGAHADLVTGRAESVAAAASRWGLGHPGRFASDYRRAFGQLPSTTLRAG